MLSFVTQLVVATTAVLMATWIASTEIARAQPIAYGVLALGAVVVVSQLPKGGASTRGA